jgi:hypothetical protein
MRLKTCNLSSELLILSHIGPRIQCDTVNLSPIPVKGFNILVSRSDNVSDKLVCAATHLKAVSDSIHRHVEYRAFSVTSCIRFLPSGPQPRLDLRPEGLVGIEGGQELGPAIDTVLAIDIDVGKKIDKVRVSDVCRH